MAAVREFGLAVVKPLGAPAGQLETFIEVPFELGGRKVQPDGLIRTSRGGKTWATLVEVKTGSNDLEREQVECYLDVAREQGFDAVLTISNQLSPAPAVHPVEVDRRKLRKVKLHHLSWAEVLTIAVQQRVHRGVADPDQAWILGELIRYLEHPRSGALDFSDMGASWVAVRDSVSLGTLRINDKDLPELVLRWEQLLQYAALRLGRELGAQVAVALSRKELSDPSLRFAAQARSLVEHAKLSGSLRIPDAVAPLDVVADLRAGQIVASVDLDAPREGRPATRVGWLTRQLSDAPDGLRIDAFFSGSRISTSGTLGAVRANPAVLLDQPKRDIRMFRVAAASQMGTKRGTGRGAFIDSVLAAVDGFYEVVVQQLRPWTARAPRLPREGRTAVEEAGINIEPPEGDLDGDSEETGIDQGETSDFLSDVRQALEQDAGESDFNAPEEANPPGPVPSPMIVWDAAFDRIDHERRMAGPASPLLPDTSSEKGYPN